jgi:hypothetical protein
MAIRACDGRWSTPGLHHPPSGVPPTDGVFVVAADLCAPDFHVCLSVDDVAGAVGGAGCTPSAACFFATQQGTLGDGDCAPRFGGNDVIGCSACDDVEALAKGLFETQATCFPDSVRTADR